MTTTPTMAEIIDAAMESRLLDVHTCLPGKINSYNPATQTADIELQVKRMLEGQDDKFTTEDLPVLPNVPIIFPRGGGYYAAFPMKAGDPVVIIFSEASLDQYRSKASLTTPGDARRHTLMGGVAYPCDITNTGILAPTDISSSYLVVGKEGGEKAVFRTNRIEVTDDVAGGADDWVAMAAKVLTELGKIKTAYDNHTHAGGVPVVGPAEKWVNASMASSNLKADD